VTSQENLPQQLASPLGEHWLRAQDTVSTNSGSASAHHREGTGFSTNLTHFMIEGPMGVRPAERLLDRSPYEYERPVTWEGVVELTCSDPAAWFPPTCPSSVNDFGRLHLPARCKIQHTWHPLAASHPDRQPRHQRQRIRHPVDGAPAARNLLAVQIPPAALLGQP
jgi:hypothetical protein